MPTMSEPFTIIPDAVYSEGELREYLSLTSAAVARARRTGKLRFARQGNQFLYRGQWLLDWLEADATARQPETLKEVK